MTDKTPIPYNEKHRLAALRSYQVLDTVPEAEFDDLTGLVARHFGVPTVLISLLDESRQWFKSRVGLDAAETPREMAFCAYAILGVRPLVVCDAKSDPRFDRNPLVTGDPFIRFYAGAPLITPAGFKLGTLCLIDSKPWTGFSQEPATDLVTFAGLVMQQLDARRRLLAAPCAAAEGGIAIEALEDVIAHLAHEMLTPLSAMVGNADVIEQQGFGDDCPDRYRQCARQIGDIGRYACDLAHRTLDVASLRSGEISLQEEWLAAADVGSSIDCVMARFAETFNVAVRVGLLDTPFSLFADRVRLQQMLLNLLGNAMKYTPAGGHIELYARNDCDDALDLTVADNGPGMSSEETQRALLPFGRIQRAGDAEIEGYGLGLPLTKRLVELHGGRLLIDSVEGHGTAVTLRFPAHRVRRNDAPAGDRSGVGRSRGFAV